MGGHWSYEVEKIFAAEGQIFAAKGNIFAAKEQIFAAGGQIFDTRLDEYLPQRDKLNNQLVPFPLGSNQFSSMMEFGQLS